MEQKADSTNTQPSTRAKRPAEALETTHVAFRLRTYRLLRRIIAGFIVVSLANFIFSSFFHTPKMYRINRENRELKLRYRILEERIRTARARVEEIRHRDNHVYRSLFATDSTASDGAAVPYPDEKYASLAGDEYAPLMIGTWQQLDALARELYFESVSFDELQTLARNKEKMSAAIPAIWPIDRARLHNDRIGAFNPRRLHPILHRIVPHNGVDFGCDRGTPVYATGDAVVEAAVSSGHNGGFGRMVLLDHEFGYKTRYAHLDKVLVKPGDRVVRGQKIGEAGNTGRSTSTHLHYEVLHRGRPVNPINYFNRNMTSEEYDKLMSRMRETNFEKL
ncbi:M23 family metallopeptidase [uncultured Alistipes sp.]|uniref:M23 family metallopeptidase n=1 Tax=uncultured Alistipes sp. TaxID=538949 RepID=UPI0026386F2F|nr:M23 family metallopeptidase [uncultured Alistipes sp.]